MAYDCLMVTFYCRIFVVGPHGVLRDCTHTYPCIFFFAEKKNMCVLLVYKLISFSSYVGPVDFTSSRTTLFVSFPPLLSIMSWLLNRSWALQYKVTVCFFFQYLFNEIHLVNTNMLVKDKFILSALNQIFRSVKIQ